MCTNGHQYNETNVMHFSFNLLRIKGLYMFRALLAHPQESLNKRHLVYCVRIMSVGCATIAVPAIVAPITFTFFSVPRLPRRTCHHSASSVLAVRISCRVIAVFVFRKPLFIN
jgi:hypothetical protein